MARKKRVIRAGFCYHVIMRGNGGKDLFKDDLDRVRFCLFLQYAAEKHKLAIHAFCLMSNHVHLVVQPLTDDLSSGIHTLAFRYAQHFNRRYEWKGHLYQGRFKAIIIQSGNYLRQLVRYIHLNPVRAKMVEGPDQYLWSSHLAYAENTQYAWLSKSLILELFNGGSQALLQYVTSVSFDAQAELLAIRESVFSGAYGDAGFLENLENSMDKEPVVEKVNSLKEIVGSVCCQMDIPLKLLSSDRRDLRLVQARAIVAILTRRLGVGNFQALGKEIQRDSTSLAKLVKKMEQDPFVVSVVERLMPLMQGQAL
jgi:putative transposase